ncbi:MAG: hypothetical protein ABIF77_11890 [bacterium]
MMNIIRAGVALLAILCHSGDCRAQATTTETDTTSAATDLRSEAPKIYITCDYCDEDYLRTDINFVNFVRDRKLADVHILVSEQTTGGGGSEFTVEFIGLGPYSGQTDTLRFNVLDADTDDTVRQEMARTIKLGLVRHVARTPLAKYVEIEYTQPSEPTTVIDRWNYWVFEIDTHLNINGEESYHYLYAYGDISASRVTEASKIDLSIYGSYNENKFDLGDETLLSLSRSKGWHGEFYLSINNHWSAGVMSSVNSSTYSNRDVRLSAAPAIEFNVFPYEESTRRQLRIGYHLSTKYFDYMEETIFGKTQEWLYAQNLSVELALIQPWGSVSSSLWGSHYLHDFHKNRLGWYNQLSLNLFRGFSFNLNGNISRVRDQLSLPGGDLTQEQILLRQHEVATDYSYWGWIGISYQFGSIYNNIVNPRFGD